MKYTFLICFCIFFSLSHAQTLEVSGVVFIDENANGIRESSEKTLRNVLVSNGVELVETNRKGRFKLTVEKGAAVFPVLPSGYSFNKQHPWWYLADEETSRQKSRREVDFGLIRIPHKEDFRTLVIGDIQVEDEEELGYADRSILSELRKRNDYDFSIFLGDLVNDEPGMFPSVKRMMGELQKPAWSVYGNHDRNTAHPHPYQHLDYSTHFGPATYSFFQEEVLFVVLNTIEPVGKFGYDGSYAATDLQFLAELLKKKEDHQLLVISQHIPLPMMDNKEALLELLEDQEKVLLLSGHTHTVFQNYRETGKGSQIHELTAGAVSGHWWTGQKDWQGIPLSLMQDGTPRGYFEIDFFRKKKSTDYQIRYKAVGLAPDYQLSLWFGAPGTEITRRLTKENTDIIANVFAGDPGTLVSLRVDEGEWQEMQRTRMIDPYVSRIKDLQDEKLYPDQVSKRSPYLSRSSSHIWTGNAGEDLEAGLHKLEVWARNDKGLDHRETAWFWFN